jgi:16S rRNA processing protein RimM
MDGTSSSRSSTTRSERRLALARVLGVKGLRGGVRIEVLTDWPEHLDPGASVYLDQGGAVLTVARSEPGGRTPVLYFEGHDTREAVEPLVGLRVEEPGGVLVGELVEIFRAGENEVYRVEGPAGERLIPALRSVVLEIDLGAQRMIVAPDDAETVS